MRKIKISFIVWMLFLLGGCSKDYLEDTPMSGPKLVVSSASVATSVGGTRSVISLSNGSIGVFRVAGNGYSAQSNIQYSYDGAQWNTQSDIYLNNNTASFCAYYPYNASVTGTAVALSSQAYDTSLDLCYAYNTTASNAACNVIFDLQHAYALMTINIARSSDYSGTGAISQISISNPGLNGSANLDISNGSYSSVTGSPNGTISYNPGISSINSGTTVSSRVLLVPVTTSMSGNLVFKFVIDGVEKEVPLDVVSNSLSTLTAGYNYQINFTLGPSLVESNCYMVKPGGTVCIPISRANTGWVQANMGTAIPGGTNWTADLLWTDNANVLKSNGVVQSVAANTAGGYIVVKAGSAMGNAVVEAKNPSGTTVWSWHIWVTDYDPNNGGTTYIDWGSEREIMDRNLGAISTNDDETAFGLLYQWGRKDPFPGANSSGGNIMIYGSISTFTAETSTSNGLLSSIQNPGIFYCGTSNNSYDWYSSKKSTHNNALWGGGSTTAPTAKTVYDPCPVGWRVPFYDNGDAPYQDYGYYPAAGYRSYSNGKPTNVESNGYYWTANASSSSKSYYFLSNNDASKTQYRAAGMSVRCVKDE